MATSRAISSASWIVRPLGNQALDVVARRQVDALGKLFDVEDNDAFHAPSLRFGNRSHQADFKQAVFETAPPEEVSGRLPNEVYGKQLVVAVG